jgi:uncharacterized membrane protein
MTSSAWKKRFAVLRNWLYLYPAPEPMPYTWWTWLALGLVALLTVVYAVYFIVYMVASHNAFLTHAEDLGIMDQAVWSVFHSPVLHQTVCNIVNDTNCYSLSGISRFAIHFEPILFPVSVLYLIWPDARMLLVLQVLVVAAGAFPAFWLARLRLRNDLAAVAIAALYLLYPAQQQAVTFDFHAVTFTASLLLFVLYFMYTRRTVWMFVFAILAMACKEEIPVIVALFGLWSIIFQQRWRSGAALIGLGIVWVGVYFLVIHIASPTGAPLLSSRYHSSFSLLLHPTTLIKQDILEPQHMAYLRILFSPAAYLPLLAPWVLVLAVPTLALNLLSTDVQQYTGLFQYSAEIVPVLIFATIEGIVVILWVLQLMFAPFQTPQKSAKSSLSDESESPQRSASSTNSVARMPLPVRLLHYGVLAFLALGAVFSVARADDGFYGKMPYTQSFTWPQVTAHDELAQKFIDMIPADASVSAQSALVPHVSHRRYIYMFPYGDEQADYVFLDVSSDIYPYFAAASYEFEVKRVLLSNKYGVVAAQDGYILLKRGLPPPGISPYSVTHNTGLLYTALPDLPQSFCTYIQVQPDQIIHQAQATFTGLDGQSSLKLVGYNVSAAHSFSIGAGYMQVTTDWEVQSATLPPLVLQVFILDSTGHLRPASVDFPAQFWCPTNAWKPGTILQLSSRVFQLKGHFVSPGPASIAIQLSPMLPTTSALDAATPAQTLPVVVNSGPANVLVPPGTNALQLGTFTLTQ